MRQSSWMLVIGVFAGTLPVGRAEAFEENSAGAAAPSIVFFLVDDLGWSDLGCFGSGFHETPHIDRLAAEGMKFTNAYSNGPNCAPTRASLMSGRYPPRHGVLTVGSGTRGQARHRKLVPPANETVLAPRFRTIAEVLRDGGYATAHMGKWHLGKAPDAGPRQQGFDVNVGGDQRGHPATYFSPYRNKNLADGPPGEYLTDRLTAEALRFIEAHRKKRFFLHLAYFSVHTPIEPRADLVARHRDKPPVGSQRSAAYAAMVHAVDESVGRVLALLGRLSLTSRTLVILTSDNGGVGGYRAAGVRGAKDITDNAPLRGGKGMLYEGGLRVPLLVRWPGVARPASVCEAPVLSIDFYPTLAEAAGAPSAALRDCDGASLAPLLRAGEVGKLERDALYWHFPAYLQASARDGTWRTTPAGAVRSGSFKLIEFFENGAVELYHLEADIGETENLASKLPGKTSELLGRLRAWRREVGARLPAPVAAGK